MHSAISTMMMPGAHGLSPGGEGFSWKTMQKCIFFFGFWGRPIIWGQGNLKNNNNSLQRPRWFRAFSLQETGWQLQSAAHPESGLDQSSNVRPSHHYGGTIHRLRPKTIVPAKRQYGEVVGNALSQIDGERSNPKFYRSRCINLLAFFLLLFVTRQPSQCFEFTHQKMHPCHSLVIQQYV